MGQSAKLQDKKNEILMKKIIFRLIIALVVVVILEPLGYTIETFRAPESALRAFTAAAPQPALIITDYAMHTMTGLE